MTTMHRESGRAGLGLLSARLIGGVALSVGVLCASVPAWALTKTCLTGTDPSAANDAAQIRAVQAMIAAQCNCAGFDGVTKGQKHLDYVKCAAGIITAQAKAGALRSQCKGTVKKFYSVSTCGWKASLGKVACVKTTMSGKVTCAIKPASACTSKPGKYDQLVCGDWPSCIDSADSNGDLVLGSGPAGNDSGQCICCDGQPADACQTDIAVNPNDCGSCGHQCRTPSGQGASAGCLAGTCIGHCSGNQTLCEPTADGGGACTEGDCPQLTELIGNTTSGVPYLDICPALGILSGFTVGMQNGYIGQIAASCGGAGVFGSNVTLDTHGGAGLMHHDTQTLECPQPTPPTVDLAKVMYIPNMANMAVGIEPSTDGTHITQLTLYCAPLSVTITDVQEYNDAHGDLNVVFELTTIDVGATFKGPSVGVPGGTSGVADCPAGQVANSANFRAGNGLNAIGLGCQPPPVGTRLPVLNMTQLIRDAIQNPTSVSCSGGGGVITAALAPACETLSAPDCGGYAGRPGSCTGDAECMPNFSTGRCSCEVPCGGGPNGAFCAPGPCPSADEGCGPIMVLVPGGEAQNGCACYKACGADFGYCPTGQVCAPVDPKNYLSEYACFTACGPDPQRACYSGSVCPAGQLCHNSSHWYGPQCYCQ